MSIVDEIPQWSTADKTTGFRGQSKFGAGKTSVGQWPVYVCCTGTMTSDGSLTADASLEQVLSEDQAAALVGKRSMCMQQVRVALKSGANVMVCPPAEAAGAVAAHIDVTFGGTWTESGTVDFAVNGEIIQVPIGSSDDTTDAALNFELACGALEYLPCTADATAAVTTLTIASKGTQGNSYLLGWDLSNAPAGLTVTAAGGTALHDKLVPFHAGTGTESVANIIDLLEQEQIDYIAAAQNDSTNAQLFRTHVISEMQPNIGHLESVFFGSIATLATAGSFASSTVNNEQARCIWSENCETHPAVLAASAAGLVAAQVGGNPNTVWAGQTLPGVSTRRYKEDRAGHTSLQAALNTGLTPLEDIDGAAVIHRDCTTKSLSGGVPYFKTYGWPEVDVPFRMRKVAGVTWKDRQAGNPYCGPDPADGEKTAGVGVETPSGLVTALTAEWKAAEAANWIWLVDDNPILAEYNADRECIVFTAPVKVRPQNLAAGGTIKQVA